jgi:hypothetical protein
MQAGYAASMVVGSLVGFCFLIVFLGECMDCVKKKRERIVYRDIATEADVIIENQNCSPAKNISGVYTCK